MTKTTLDADIRTVTGRKVKTLRAAGKIPATVYGKKVKSVSVTVDGEAFEKTYASVGETGLVDLKLKDGSRPVLIHTVQKDPVRGTLQHIEFHQVDLTQKVHADIPIVTEGIAPAVEQKLGILIQTLNELEVEALPTELPDRIIVDISKLAQVNDELKVSDLTVGTSVTVLTDPQLSVVRISPLAKEEEVAPPPAEAEAEEGAAAAEEAPAGEKDEGSAEKAEKETAEKPEK